MKLLLKPLALLQIQTCGFCAGFILLSIWFDQIALLWANEYDKGRLLLIIVMAIDLSAFWAAYRLSHSSFQQGAWLALMHVCAGAALSILGALILPKGITSLYLAVFVVTVASYLRGVAQTRKQAKIT